MIRLTGPALLIFVVGSLLGGVIVGTMADSPAETEVVIDVESGTLTVGDNTTEMNGLRDMKTSGHPMADAPGNVIDWDPYRAQAAILSSAFGLISTSMTAVAGVVYYSPIPDVYWNLLSPVAVLGMTALYARGGGS